MNAKEPVIGRIVDFLFSNDSRKWLLLILLLGMVLRFVASSNIPPVADEMVHGVLSIGMSKLAPLSAMTQAPIWQYLTDYAYRIFGVHLITARFLSFIFGSLSILLVYLLGTMIFNRKVGLVSSFLLAVSPFHITWTASYHDQTMMFFVLLASYFFIKEYNEKKQVSILSAVFLGIALLVKIITGVFLVVFGMFIFWILFRDYKTDRKLFSLNLKRTIIFGIVIVLSMLPIFSYNYFLYKEKGIVDLPFAQFLRINAEFYTGPGLAHGEGFVLGKLPMNLYSVLTVYFLKEDPILLLLASLGIIFILKERKRKQFGEMFLLVTFFFALLVIASAIVLQTHYTSFVPLMALFGAVFIDYFSNKLKNIGWGNYVLYGLILIILVLNVYSIRGPLTSRSAVEKVRLFSQQISPSDLVLVDSRIYRGDAVWMMNDKNYIDASYLTQLIQISNSEGAKRQTVKTFFIECVNDDCGWGTIKDQPELNQSMEQLIEAFRNISKISEIFGGGSIIGVRGIETSDKPFFRIYEFSLQIDPAIFPSLKKTRNHFFYHIPRDEFPQESFDYYQVSGFFNNLLNIISYTILYFMMLLTVLSTIIPFYLIFQEKNNL